MGVTILKKCFRQRHAFVERDASMVERWVLQQDQSLALDRLRGDPEGMNGSRTDSANIAIRAFQVATATDDETVLGDLLANLPHWCDANQQDFEIALDRARWHYDAETSAVTSEEAGV